MGIKLSAVLISKDERETIARCIRSLKGMDQIVVLDTGSSDMTPLMAQNEGAEVHVGVQRDPFHFSEARNEALSHATGDWVLSIDADETLRPGSIAQLRSAANSEDKAGFRVLHLDRGVDTRKFRFFRREKFKWKYRVHEVLDPLSGVAKIGRLDGCVLEHHPAPDRKNSTRNLSLLKLCVEESPEHHQALMKLGLELVAAKDVDAGIERLHQYAETTAAPNEWRSEALCQTGRLFAKQGDLESALVDLEEAHKLSPLRREPLWYAAVELIRAAKLKEARSFLKACLSIPESAKVDFEWTLPAVWGTLVGETLRECEAMLRSAEQKSRLLEGS